MQASKSWLSAVLGLGLVVLTIGMIRGQSSVSIFFKLRQSREVLAAANHNLTMQNTALKAEIEKIEQSASYAKRVLRDKYHITDAGERIIFFPD